MARTNEHMRRELAAFLTTKRKQLQPAEYGFPTRPNRRTLGLRREEVAELAQVGPTWYTWIEQGRDIRASAHVLQNIAQVLRLSGDETRHLLSLAGHASSLGSEEEPAAVPSLQDVVDAVTCPAFIRNGRYDVLTWNIGANALFDFGDYDSVLERNLLWRLFNDNWHHIKIPTWKELAKQFVADLRVTYAYHGDAPAFRSLVKDLCVLSPLFAQWWSEYPIGQLKGVSQTIEHALVGTLHVHVNHFDVTGYSGMTLVLVTPEPGTKTAAKLQALA